MTTPIPQPPSTRDQVFNVFLALGIALSSTAALIYLVQQPYAVKVPATFLVSTATFFVVVTQSIMLTWRLFRLVRNMRRFMHWMGEVVNVIQMQGQVIIDSGRSRSLQAEGAIVTEQREQGELTRRVIKETFTAMKEATRLEGDPPAENAPETEIT
jgi:hypothetical protein